MAAADVGAGIGSLNMVGDDMVSDCTVQNIILPDGADAALPLVTLAVKAYCQEATVRAAIESVFAQTWPNLEILLSDDCSPDGTFRIMEEMAAAYSGPHRVRLNRNSPNLGIVGHENRIWELASGQLIGHCAGDDICLPERITRQVQAWQAGGGTVYAVHSAMQLVGGDGEDLGIGRPHRASAIDPSLAGLVLNHATGIGATALYDRRLYDVFGPIAADTGIEDRPLFLRAALLGEIAYIDEPLVRYCVDGVSGRRAAGTGAREYLYGARIKLLHWQVATDRLLLRDAAATNADLPADLQDYCLGFIDEMDFQLRLSKADGLGRLKLLREALGVAVRTGRVAPVLEACKYAAGPLYIWASDLRHRSRLEKLEGARGEQTVRRFKWDFPGPPTASAK